MKISVQAQELQPGDVTSGTHETIIKVERGRLTPSGKIEVTLQKGGQKRLAYWGMYTKIWVERK